jgi:hypothetical protein
MMTAITDTSSPELPFSLNQDAVKATTRMSRYRSSAFVPLFQRNERWIGEENYWHVLELNYTTMGSTPLWIHIQIFVSFFWANETFLSLLICK